MFLFLAANISYSQGFNKYRLRDYDKIVVVTKGSSIFIETYKESYGGKWTIDDVYRLGPSAKRTLLNGLDKTIEWAELNVGHKKEFQKEVCCRFKVMNKDTYEFHGYVEEFTTEFNMIFRGHSDGTFELVIGSVGSRLSFLELYSKKEIKDLKDMLNGKSVNEEIDDIFKN